MQRSERKMEKWNINNDIYNALLDVIVYKYGEKAKDDWISRYQNAYEELSEEDQKKFLLKHLGALGIHSEEDLPEEIRKQYEANKLSRSSKKHSGKRRLIFYSIIGLLFLFVIIWAVTSLSGKNQKTNKSEDTITSSVARKNLDEWEVDMSYDPNSTKVIQNSAKDKNSLPDNKEEALNILTEEMKHKPNVLLDKAKYTSVLPSETKVEELIETRNGKQYLNEKGKEAFYAVKNIFRPENASIEKVQNHGFSTGIVQGKHVLDETDRDYSNWNALTFRKENPKTKQVNVYYNLLYCGNSVYSAKDPKIPQGKVDNPKDEPKPNPKDPDPKPKDPEPKPNLEAKDPSKEVYAQRGNKEDGRKEEQDGKGPETSKVQLPEEYEAPKPPQASSSSQSSTSSSSTSSESITPPREWTGSGSFTDSNGTTKVSENGAVSTPSGKNYSSLKDSVPPVESSATGSSSVIDESISEPPIDD
jgi:hypothetical protein